MRPRWPGRLRLRTLRSRVLAGVLLVILIALAGFDFAAVSALRGYLIGQTDTQLKNVVDLYRASPYVVHKTAAFWQPVAVKTSAVRLRAGKQVPKRFSVVGPHLLLRPAVLDQYIVEVIAAPGPMRLLAGNSDLRPRLPGELATLFQSRDLTVTSLNGHAQLRLIAVPLRLRAANVGTLVITTSLSGVNRTVRRLELILIIGSVAAGLLVAGGVMLVARRGLRPIETMAAQADRITSGDLTDRVGPHDPQTEVGRLATALNGMLARIETDVQQRVADQEAARRFFADASHELRTPLASLRANAELYQQGALTRRSQVDEAMRRIALEAHRMGTLVDDMLKLARLDQYPDRRNDPVDCTAVVGDCAERARAASPDHAWRTEISPGLVATGDEELLRRAVDNLLTNVRTHTPPGTTAAITAARHNGCLEVQVSDDGPGVPPGQLSRLFDRFYRATAPSNRPGSGLGLAIAAAIASAHGGSATAALNEPRGLRVTLTLPAGG